MESSRPCQSCRSRNLDTEPDTGRTFCTSCGVVQEFDNYDAQIGGITGPTGTYIRVGTIGVGSTSEYKEKKIYEAQKLIDDFMRRIGLFGSKAQEVKLLIDKITDGEYGQGNWFRVFIGACTYVVMRKDQKMRPIVEVADAVGCDVYELGRMITRVVEFTDMKLPEFDIVYSFDRAIKECHSFREVPTDTIGRMLKQGIFLIQCLIKWFVTTGRQPMPVVAAVLFFVSELNEVNAKLGDIAKELHVALATCKKRYKELLERLVQAARVLPWGKDVTVKNILKNAPFVIQYMEMKSMKKGKESFEPFLDIDGLVDDCLRKEIGYGFNNQDCSSSYFEIDRVQNLSTDRFQISPECLTMIYSNFLNELSLVNASAEETINREMRGNIDLQLCDDWWKGISDMSKKLILKEVLEKDVGLDVMPPSFDKACLDNKKRRERIKAAKLRIQKIMRPRIDDSGYDGSDVCLSTTEKPERKKRKRGKVDIDWEDFIIETLILHNVKEEEIEKGHYNVLMDLHVFCELP